MKLNKTKSTGSTQSSVDEDEALLVEKIQAIHDHFQETTSSNNQEDTNCSFEDPIFEEINKAFKLGDTNEESNGSPIDQQLDSLMTSIMDELLSKEVLYEPLKELSTKYPKWLQEHSNDCNIESSASNSTSEQEELMAASQSEISGSTVPGKHRVLKKKRCTSCTASKTPYWREGWEKAILLCNACGIRYQKYKKYCLKCLSIARKDDKGRLHCPDCNEKL